MAHCLIKRAVSFVRRKVLIQMLSHNLTLLMAECFGVHVCVCVYKVSICTKPDKILRRNWLFSKPGDNPTDEGRSEACLGLLDVDIMTCFSS